MAMDTAPRLLTDSSSSSSSSRHDDDVNNNKLAAALHTVRSGKHATYCSTRTTTLLLRSRRNNNAVATLRSMRPCMPACPPDSFFYYRRIHTHMIPLRRRFFGRGAPLRTLSTVRSPPRTARDICCRCFELGREVKWRFSRSIF
jgi:hypothetical protein